jgi:hypothetical protein
MYARVLLTKRNLGEMLGMRASRRHFGWYACTAYPLRWNGFAVDVGYELWYSVLGFNLNLAVRRYFLQDEVVPMIVSFVFRAHRYFELGVRLVFHAVN